MPWNDSENNTKHNQPKNNDPWQAQQPPDLEEIFKRFLSKLRGGKKDSTTPQPPMPSSGIGTGISILLAGIFFLWLLSGIFIVGAAEKAAILRFGRYIETVGAGPHWIPRFIDKAIVLNTENVSDYSYTANMLTKDENLVSVAIVVQYRIADLEHYLFNVANPDESLKQATSSSLRQVVGNTTLDQLITEGREAWGSSVQESLIRILESYKVGLQVVNVFPQRARAPENVQDAFDDAIKAQEDERRFIEQARAYEARVVPIAVGKSKRIIEEAQAYAKQVVLKAKGDTAEFLAILPQYQQAPFVTSERMYLEALTQIFSHTTKILIDNKNNNLLYLPLEKLTAPKQQVSSVPSTLSQESSGPLLSSDESERIIHRSFNRLERK